VTGRGVFTTDARGDRLAETLLLQQDSSGAGASTLLVDEKTVDEKKLDTMNFSGIFIYRLLKPCA
jgi:hypothetical protein